MFISTCGKIGMLRNAGPPTVRAFMLSQSVIEDFRALAAERALVEEGRRPARRDKLLSSTMELKSVFDGALASAEQAVSELRKFERLSWFAWWRR